MRSRYLMACGWLAAMGALGGCTQVRFEGVEGRVEITPREAISTSNADGQTVVWGGRIVAIRNLQAYSELLVLGQPLSRGNMPLLGRESTGRFIVSYPGFLEPLDYAPGRYVSMAGVIETLGAADWTGVDPNPVAWVASEQIHLWPRDPASWQPRVSIGLGVGVSR